MLLLTTTQLGNGKVIAPFVTLCGTERKEHHASHAKATDECAGSNFGRWLNKDGAKRVLHMSDWDKGVEGVSEQFPSMVRGRCGHHHIKNGRTASAPGEKGWHDNQCRKVRGAETFEAFKAALSLLHKTRPSAAVAGRPRGALSGQPDDDPCERAWGRGCQTCALSRGPRRAGSSAAQPRGRSR